MSPVPQPQTDRLAAITAALQRLAAIPENDVDADTEAAALARHDLAWNVEQELRRVVSSATSSSATTPAKPSPRPSTSAAVDKTSSRVKAQYERYHRLASIQAEMRAMLDEFSRRDAVTGARVLSPLLSGTGVECAVLKLSYCPL